MDCSGRGCGLLDVVLGLAGRPTGILETELEDTFDRVFSGMAPLELQPKETTGRVEQYKQAIPKLSSYVIHTTAVSKTSSEPPKWYIKRQIYAPYLFYFRFLTRGVILAPFPAHITTLAPKIRY